MFQSPLCLWLDQLNRNKLRRKTSKGPANRSDGGRLDEVRADWLYFSLLTAIYFGLAAVAARRRVRTTGLSRLAQTSAEAGYFCSSPDEIHGLWAARRSSGCRVRKEYGPLVLAPVQRDSASVAKAAPGIDPPITNRSNQVTDSEARPVGSLAMHVDRHFAGSEDFAPKIYRDTRLATGPLASYPIAQHDPLRLEAVGRLGRAAGGVAHLPAIDPAPVVAGRCRGSRAAHLIGLRLDLSRLRRSQRIGIGDLAIGSGHAARFSLNPPLIDLRCLGSGRMGVFRPIALIVRTHQEDAANRDQDQSNNDERPRPQPVHELAPAGRRRKHAEASDSGDGEGPQWLGKVLVVQLTQRLERQGELI